MLKINREKLLTKRENLLNLLTSKQLNLEMERMIREDLRSVEKEIQQLELEADPKTELKPTD